MELLIVFALYAIGLSIGLGRQGFRPGAHPANAAPPAQPRRLLIVGATGGTGRQLVAQALERGFAVTALARNPAKLAIEHERLTVARGDVLDAASVEAAMRCQDAVLCALGHRPRLYPTRILSRGTDNIVRAMEACGVRRLVCETSLGIGDSAGRAHKWARTRACAPRTEPGELPLDRQRVSRRRGGVHAGPVGVEHLLARGAGPGPRLGPGSARHRRQPRAPVTRRRRTVNDRRGEKIGWTAGWLGGFIWVLALAVVMVLQKKHAQGLLGLALAGAAAVAVVRITPWRFPKAPYWKLMLAPYGLFCLSVVWGVWAFGGLRGAGLTWWNLLWLAPLLLPIVGSGRRTWAGSGAQEGAALRAAASRHQAPTRDSADRRS